ncbi:MULTISPECIES: GNAT family N-acetyltransferase [unclassified Solwaraspora]|uniref:GNAT family N-acetyltransferase n=1 Tax=unclassified Solwaraspora TaxID=2627926 RepID=UPI00259B7584|nr:GNAT family N-acetyltransferase [Solwaraspora sp. WMMA2056]WJK41929.1 GNAT family N-acetyltransferase [Solwaraspora sp. WMMA2056]
MLLRIERADFADPGLSVFLQAHLDDIAPTAPAESRHALDLTGLRKPGVQLWVARDGATIVGTGGLAEVEPGHEEIKSMRTDPRHRGRGIATAVLRHLLEDARRRGVRRVSLETGSMEFFAAARALYAKAGFVECAPFGSYRDDPNSTFFTKRLEQSLTGSAQAVT